MFNIFRPKPFLRTKILVLSLTEVNQANKSLVVIDNITKSRLMGVDDVCSRYSVKKGYTEDVSFLLYQRGERKMLMGENDVSFVERLEKNKLRKKNWEGGKRVLGKDHVSKLTTQESDMESEVEDQESDKISTGRTGSRRRQSICGAT